MNCPICKNWCRDGSTPITEHHKRCPNYNPESDSIILVSELIRGIEAWASDEDGVHPKAWDAYLHALVYVGDLDKLHRAIKSKE